MDLIQWLWWYSWPKITFKTVQEFPTVSLDFTGLGFWLISICLLASVVSCCKRITLNVIHALRWCTSMVLSSDTLTPSLPWYHLKTTSKSAKLWNPYAFLSPFWHWHVKGLSPQCIALTVDVLGPENIPFAGASVHLLARKLYRLVQRRG